MKLGSGEVVATQTGRTTTPFPQVKMGPRNTGRTLKAVDSWLIDNAIEEAKARGDRFNQRQFEAAKASSVQQADKDAAEEYLFGDYVPPVPKSILKPLTTPEPTNAQEVQETPAAQAEAVAADPTTTNPVVEPETPVEAPQTEAGVSAPVAIENTDAGISETSPEPPTQLKSLMITVPTANGKTGRIQAFKKLKEFNARLDKLQQMVKCLG